MVILFKILNNTLKSRASVLWNDVVLVCLAGIAATSPRFGLSGCFLSFLFVPHISKAHSRVSIEVCVCVKVNLLYIEMTTSFWWQTLSPPAYHQVCIESALFYSSFTFFAYVCMCFCTRHSSSTFLFPSSFFSSPFSLSHFRFSRVSVSFFLPLLTQSALAVVFRKYRCQSAVKAFWPPFFQAYTCIAIRQLYIYTLYIRIWIAWAIHCVGR